MRANNAQPPISRIMYAAVITAIVFGVTFIFSARNDKKNESPQPFFSVEEVETYLDNSHKIKLNIDDKGMADLKKLRLKTNKSFYLDLSGSTITSIPEYAFYECTSLIGINIPDSVTDIGEHAFYFCENLTRVTFEGTIKEFYYYAFRGNLRRVFYEKDAENGTPGTYTATAPMNESSEWTRQP
jgi:hypothetical protein